MKYNIIFTLLLILMIFSCKKDENRNNYINGHWHLFPTKTKSDKYFYKLNIKEDSIAILEGVNYLEPIIRKEKEFKLRRNIIKAENKMLLWIEGMYEEFSFIIKGDSLFLESDNKTKYIGLKKNEKECDVQLDNFSTQFVTINLERVDDLIRPTKIKDYSNVLNVYIGVNKFTNKTAIQFNYRIISLDNMALEIEKFKVKVPKNKQDNFRLIFHLDRNINKEIISELLEKLDISMFAKVYRTVMHNKQIEILQLDSVSEIYD